MASLCMPLPPLAVQALLGLTRGASMSCSGVGSRTLDLPPQAASSKESNRMHADRRRVMLVMARLDSCIKLDTSKIRRQACLLVCRRCRLGQFQLQYRASGLRSGRSGALIDGIGLLLIAHGSMNITFQFGKHA